MILNKINDRIGAIRHKLFIFYWYHNHPQKRIFNVVETSSINGLMVNRVRVNTAILKDGDSIVVNC
jgi:hypothetical protein